jgi:hypothetical protein
MMYQQEFSRMKKIYDKMPMAKREMVGPILALPPVSMALFFFVLLPFGLASLAFVLFAGALATLLSATMIATMVDLRQEYAEWRAGDARPEDRAGDIAIRMLSIANDPGQAGAGAKAEQAEQAAEG